MNQTAFDKENLGQQLGILSLDEINSLEFGVIGFDNQGIVKLYNSCESRMAGLSTDSVIDSDLFTTVAPCMNNFLVAQKFEDAIDDESDLDEIIDYVLTLKMKPVKVKLRLISSLSLPLNYVLILRQN